jgi:hypothetical protein
MALGKGRSYFPQACRPFPRLHALEASRHRRLGTSTGAREVSSFHAHNAHTLPPFNERSTFSTVGDALGEAGGEAPAECASAFGWSFRQPTASVWHDWTDVLAEKETRA